jgi:rhodanese-related sulfurtransferase
VASWRWEKPNDSRVLSHPPRADTVRAPCRRRCALSRKFELSRRDFLNGVLLASGGAAVASSFPLRAFASTVSGHIGSDPRALRGGNLPATFNIAHWMRDQRLTFGPRTVTVAPRKFDRFSGTFPSLPTPARPTDWLQLHIIGSISTPYYDLKSLDDIPNDGTWVMAYCACPHHASGEVVDQLRKRGYMHTAVLDEGVFAWQHKGNPIVHAEGTLPSPAPPVLVPGVGPGPALVPARPAVVPNRAPAAGAGATRGGEWLRKNPVGMARRSRRGPRWSS